MQEVAGPLADRDGAAGIGPDGRTPAVVIDPRLRALPGVGPRTAERLRARGLSTVEALLAHLPRGYDDLRRVTPLAELVAAGGVVLVQGKVTRVRIFPRRLLDVLVEQGGVTVRARWFRPPRGMHKSFPTGQEVRLAGPVRAIDRDGAAGSGKGAAGAGSSGFEIIQPAVFPAAGDAGEGVRPRYPVVEGVSGRVLEKIIAAAVDRHAGEAIDLVERATAAALGLPEGAAALRLVHARAGDLAGGGWSDAGLAALAAGRSPAHRRLAFEELLLLQLLLATAREQARARPAPAPLLDDGGARRAAVRGALPFTLTVGQERAIDDIARDLASPQPMQRLLVGDVGSGKTAIAFAAAALVAAAGGQTLFMAPTEVLVDQHLRTLGEWGARLGLGVAHLTSAMPRADRARTLAACRAGAVQILIGTQALLEVGDELGLSDLRLAVVDEQHRFGVDQRARLRAPAPSAQGRGPERARGVVPHLLVMSATPIPRTLALTLYGDLDATFLRESPAGRRPVATEICAGADRRREAYQRIVEAVREGRQAYVVCPVRERAVRAGAVTAVRRAAELRRQLAPAGVRVGLLHGALDAASKEALLRGFAGGAVDVLVATTVVELGIDVPNATVMLVEEADRFGLSQLHQLRGRVGRGRFPSTCFLCPSEGGDIAAGDAGRRLAELAASQDGFRIAEADLALRGPGDLYGVRQAGTTRLGFGTLDEQIDLLERARAEAVRVAAADPGLDRAEHAGLKAAVGARAAARAVYGEESG